MWDWPFCMATQLFQPEGPRSWGWDWSERLPGGRGERGSLGGGFDTLMAMNRIVKIMICHMSSWVTWYIIPLWLLSIAPWELITAKVMRKNKYPTKRKIHKNLITITFNNNLFPFLAEADCEWLCSAAIFKPPWILRASLSLTPQSHGLVSHVTPTPQSYCFIYGCSICGIDT